MDLSIIISAVIALAAGLMVGWLATKARADQIRADLIEERRELDIELSAARQQLAQEAHWREECELLNNELRSLRDINTFDNQFKFATRPAVGAHARDFFHQ